MTCTFVPTSLNLSLLSANYLQVIGIFTQRQIHIIIKSNPQNVSPSVERKFRKAFHDSFKRNVSRPSFLRDTEEGGKKTQCATDEIDELSTRERSSRRLIGARLLKYLLGFDRSQLREESTQSQYYPPTSLRRGIMRRNSRKIGREGRERGEQGCRDTTADDFIIPWNLLKKSVAHGGNI